MSVLLLFVALIAPTIAQYSYNSPPCPNPPSSNQCACNIPDNFSTFYVIFAPSTGSKRLDSGCHTFFPLPNDPCAFTAYLTQVYSDGTVDIFTFIVKCNSSVDAIFASPSCTFLDTTIGSVNGVDISARRVINGDCSNIIYPALGLSECPNSGSLSDLPQINQLIYNYGYGATNLKLLPRNLSPQCVTSQSTTNTGNTANCPRAPCDESDDTYNYNNYYSPSYSFGLTSYPNSHSSSSCGCPN